MSRSSCFEYSLYLALPSVAITLPSSNSNSSSKDAAIPIACGNMVATPALATPCKPSFHQLYSGISSLSIASASYFNCPAISSTVIRLTNSVALCLASSLVISIPPLRIVTPIRRSGYICTPLKHITMKGKHPCTLICSDGYIQPHNKKKRDGSGKPSRHSYVW